MTGNHPFRQWREFLRLRRKATNLGISDFYKYQLFRDPPAGPDRKEDFAGWRMVNWLDEQLNDPRWHVMARDKLTMYALLSACGLAVPEIRAVYEQRNRLVPGTRTLPKPEELAAFMRDGISYPFFVKPVYGDIGRGAMSVAGYDSSNDTLILGSGDTLKIDDFIAGLGRNRSWMEVKHGYLFQEFVNQHPAISRISRHVSTARVVVLYTDQGPRPFRAVWRVVTGKNMTDNFDSGRSGNLLAEIDLNTGIVERVVQGVGFDLREVVVHPSSGVRLLDFKLPYWDEVIATVCRGARIFPMLQFQHWDIAFGDQQPVVLEVNVLGSLDVHQVASGKGIYDQILRDFVDRCGRIR
jgi:Sugar-transfer associated ATP-grasp